MKHSFFESEAGAYTLNVQAASPPDSRFEPNDNFEQASPITLPFSGSLFMGRGDEDWFIFVADRAGKLDIGTLYKSTGGDYPADLSLFDGSRNLIASAENNARLSATIQPGTYYLKRVDPQLVSSGFGVGFEYSMQIKLSP